MINNKKGGINEETKELYSQKKTMILREHLENGNSLQSILSPVCRKRGEITNGTDGWQRIKKRVCLHAVLIGSGI